MTSLHLLSVVTAFDGASISAGADSMLQSTRSCHHSFFLFLLCVALNMNHQADPPKAAAGKGTSGAAAAVPAAGAAAEETGSKGDGAGDEAGTGTASEAETVRPEDVSSAGKPLDTTRVRLLVFFLRHTCMEERSCAPKCWRCLY